MLVTIDIHSHSGYSGGVGQIDLAAVGRTMARKGVDVFGTGDVLQPQWIERLEGMLKEKEKGLFVIDAADLPRERVRFMLQTEIIFTAEINSGARKQVHTVITLPSFAACREAIGMLEKWGVKINMGRPFVVCDKPDDVAEKMFALWGIDEGLCIIPAHVMTPQGVFGSNAPVDHMADFYGDAAKKIRVAETGLSADPAVLALIPELDEISLISNSDAHSAELNRVGREYTTLRTDAMNYSEIINAMRNRKIERSAEFSPAEGRYFLTGHRAGKLGHREGQSCVFSPDTAPAGDICPICGKPLTVGVLQRALELSAIQGEPRTVETAVARQKSFCMVPLVEIISTAIGLKSIKSKRVTKIYDDIVNAAGTEAEFWRLSEKETDDLILPLVREEVAAGIRNVKTGNFTFSPLGYDGQYGRLIIGEKSSWFGIEEINGKPLKQQSLFG